jgi:hypothetical protein
MMISKNIAYKNPQGSAAACRRGDRGPRHLSSLHEIVRDYDQRFGSKATRELRFYSRMPNFDAVVTSAGMATMPGGKRWSHQRRIPAPVLEYATEALHRADLQSARSFDDLLALIEKAVSRLRGIGELYMYDTALRIGAYLRKLPEKVYLHAGTRVGAAALGLDSRARSIDLKRFPTRLRSLKPHEIEDVLCIYKEWLASARHR